MERKKTVVAHGRAGLALVHVRRCAFGDGEIQQAFTNLGGAFTTTDIAGVIAGVALALFGWFRLRANKM